MSAPYAVLVRGDDGPDVYGPYDEDEAEAAAVQVSDQTGLETEVVPLQAWQPS